MMRSVAAIFLIASAVGFAQRGGVARTGPLPATGLTHQAPVPVTGLPPRAPAGPSAGFRRAPNGVVPGNLNRQRTVIVPYPIYFGGYNYGYAGSPYPYNYDPSAAGYSPADTGYYAYPNSDPSQSPVMIVNQNFRPEPVNPVVRDYSDTQFPEPTMKKYESPAQTSNDQPTIYLIAMKDHTIFPTLAYWMQGDTLNYITSDGVQNRVSLDLVDRDFSKQLNEERQVEFKLPAR